MSDNSIIVCGFCKAIYKKHSVIVLMDEKLYYANKAECNSCNLTFYEIGEFICGKESPEKFNYYLSIAIDINKENMS